MTHFEIVRRDPGELGQPWHARVVASNGETVWTTENYADRRGAEAAIRLLDVGIHAVKNVDERTVYANTEKGQQALVEAGLAEGTQYVMCPECAQGKPGNCTDQVVHPDTDDLVACGSTR